MYFSPWAKHSRRPSGFALEYPDTSEFQDIRKHADYMWYLSFLSENHPESCRHIPEHPVRWYIHPVRYPFWEIRVKHIWTANIPFGIQYPVMVITISILQLYKIVVVNACPYRSRSSEIHRSTFLPEQSRQLSWMCCLPEYNNRHPPSTSGLHCLLHHHRD